MSSSSRIPQPPLGGYGMGKTAYAQLRQNSDQHRFFRATVEQNVFDVWEALTQCSWENIEGSEDEMNTFVREHLIMLGKDAVALLRTPSGVEIETETVCLTKDTAGQAIFDLTAALAAVGTLEKLGSNSQEFAALVRSEAFITCGSSERGRKVLKFLRISDDDDYDALEDLMVEYVSEHEVSDSVSDRAIYSSLCLDVARTVADDVSGATREELLFLRKLVAKQLALRSVHYMACDKPTYKERVAAVYNVQTALSLLSWAQLEFTEQSFLQQIRAD